MKKVKKQIKKTTTKQEQKAVEETTNRIQGIISNLNQIGTYLKGESKLPEGFSEKQHNEWLTTTYYKDVFFLITLLAQIGVVKFAPINLPQENVEGEERK